MFSLQIDTIAITIKGMPHLYSAKIMYFCGIKKFQGDESRQKLFFFDNIPPVVKNLLILNMLTWLLCITNLKYHLLGSFDIYDTLSLHYWESKDFCPFSCFPICFCTIFPVLACTFQYVQPVYVRLHHGALLGLQKVSDILCGMWRRCGLDSGSRMELTVLRHGYTISHCQIPPPT